MSSSKTPPLIYRYVAKFGANLLGIVFNIINASIVPRALGTVAYGNFEFLLSFFNQVIGFLDLGTSTAFYNKLSRHNNNISIITVYAKFVIGVFFVLIILIASVKGLGIENIVWPGQQWKFIFLAALLSYFIWVYSLFRKIIDAFGCTIRSELITVIAKIVAVFITIFLFHYSWLNVFTLFAKELFFYFSLFFLLLMIILQFKRDQDDFYSTDELKILKEFWQYSSPLILVAIIVLIVGLGDRWLLQRYSGATEQGFYALSLRIAGVSFIFSSAMIQLIMREFSIYHEQRNIEKIKSLFTRYLPILYVLSAYLAAFVSLQAENVIEIFAGHSYVDASLTMIFMAFYPVHQTYGQMNGALLLATEKTKLYGKISIFIMLLGVFITWFLLTPHEYGGVGLGSVGLAIKMLIVQFLVVNIQLWFNAKYLGLNFIHLFFHQIGVISLFLSLSWLANILSGWLMFSKLISFILSGVFYTSFILFFIYTWPQIIGSNKNEVIIFLLKSKVLAKKYLGKIL